MAQFIHLADERLAKRIEKMGIKPSAHWRTKVKYVFAVPVLKDFMVSHQWLRELKRRGMRTLVAVQFRLPDEEPVRVGAYNEEPIETTAVGAVRVFRAHTSPLGLEVTIPRKIVPGEIMRVYEPTQLVGWRFYPGAKGKKPCSCPYCSRGDINARRLRLREIEAEKKQTRAAARAADQAK